MREEMTWNDARQHCITKHTEMAHIYDIDNLTTMMNIPYKGKAWIGLYSNLSEWTWENGQPVDYQEWGDVDDGKRLCAYMTGNGTWKRDKCIAQKVALCTIGKHK